jgi:putative two-component system response regulator
MITTHQPNQPQILSSTTKPATCSCCATSCKTNTACCSPRTARALELARSEQPQLILLDVMMPGMTGYETCKLLKADPVTAAIPVIFVTALSDTDDEVVGFEAGAVDYITKPVSPPIVRARAHPPVAGGRG